MQKIVDREELKILTMLLPIKIAVKTSSYLSIRASVLIAFLLPLSASVLSRNLFAVENAVSVAEKYADNIMHMIIIISIVLSLESTIILLK
jgi:hypothetical protein